VEAWRVGKTNPSLAVQTTAQRLAAELDRDHESTANRLNEYQQMMKKKIETASRELEETKLRIQEAASLAPLDDLEDLDEEEEDRRLEEGRRGREDSDPDGHLSPCSSMDGEQEDHDPHTQSHLEVSLLESHLNINGSVARTNELAPEYCVSEPPSDDEGDGEEKGYDQIDVIEVRSFK
jgi:hypothetical protein